MFDKSIIDLKAGRLLRNVDFAAEMQETLITPVKRTLRYANLVFLFSFFLSSKVVEYMQSMPYRQARESSRMKSNQRLSSHEAESSSRDQDAASTEEHRG